MVISGIRILARESLLFRWILISNHVEVLETMSDFLTGMYETLRSQWKRTLFFTLASIPSNPRPTFWSCTQNGITYILLSSVKVSLLKFWSSCFNKFRRYYIGALTQSQAILMVQYYENKFQITSLFKAPLFTSPQRLIPLSSIFKSMIVYSNIFFCRTFLFGDNS